MNSRTYISIGLLVLVGAAVLYWLFPNDGPQHNWRETYDPESREPYGTHVLHQLLEKYHPALQLKVIDEPPASALAALDSQQHYTYLYIGLEWLLSEASRDAIYAMLDEGHDVLVISAFIDDNFYEASPVYTCQPDYWMNYDYLSAARPTWYTDTSITATFYYRNGADTLIRPYRYITMQATDCDSLDLYTPLSYINGPTAPNFVAIPVGRGNFYLHVNPILFTNYALQDEATFAYVDQVFSRLSPSIVLWDQYTQTHTPQDSPMEITSSPLSFILSQRALRWAWWLLLAGALLFIVFGGKRRQRAIPVLQRPINRSLRFIQTIGQLHYNQKDHRSIARKQYQYWLLVCRQRYKEQPQYDQSLTMERLAGKSQAPLKLIREIVYLGEQLAHKPSFSTEDLLHFHTLIQTFYRYK